MKRLAILLVALAACSPQEVVDKTVQRTAETVITGVTGPAPVRCISDHAQPAELQVLARDVGVSAGTRTVAIIKGIVARPDTQACLSRSNITMPDLGTKAG